MKLKLYKTEISLFLITLFVTGLMFQLNDITRHIRIRELRLLLLKNSNEDNKIDHIGLVANYRIQKKKYENLINQEKADLEELKIATILTDRLFIKSISIDKYEVLSVPALFLINIFRSMIGKNPILDPKDNKASVYLEIAYYYERNSYISRALEMYDIALAEEKFDRSKIAAILLHKGYCHAIRSEYTTARRELRKVIQKYSDKPVANTAYLLLRYINGFKSEIDRVKRWHKDSLDKIEKLYNLNASQDAMNIIKRIGKRFSGKKRAKMLYIKARCLENLSKKEEAIKTYQKIINEGDDKKYARSANRRMYISGVLANNSIGDKVRTLAIKNNARLNDRAFRRMLREESRLRIDKRDNSWLKKQISLSQGQNPILRTKSIDSIIRMRPGRRTVLSGKRAGVKEKQRKTKIKIKTTEGNIFIGTLIEESSYSITISSILGNVTIPKKNIAKKTIIR
jgi:tetratricopeptide (TPR) repeat protein